MSLTRVLALVGAFALGAGINSALQRPQEQAFMNYGQARISLGMSVEPYASSATPLAV